MASEVFGHDALLLLVGLIKDKVFVPPLPQDLVELRGRIRNEFSAVTRESWCEYGRKWSIFRITKDAHIESL
ncbi:hypothetical protein TNCV_1031401 [Trichonephila clavipes]|nr:hypothetical protein TNCV_1031401 [Trichonephila clavipes]